jgi:SAM-dependent methyltransferase
MNYYDENGQEFFDGTVNTDMTPHYDEFLGYVAEGGHILDVGCGSGRDTRNFKKLGYDVTAIDGSLKMCELASEYSGVNVKHMQFQEIEFTDEFDGIWASASLLHVPSTEIDQVLDKLKTALKKDGTLYASFKLGDFEGKRNGRFFNDFTESTACDLFEKNGFEIIKTWLTNDARLNRQDEKWVNILANKNNEII